MAIAHELLKDAVLARVHVDNTEIQPTTDDDSHVVITGHLGEDDEDDVEWAAIPFIYAVMVQSFGDARPRGLSEREFADVDQWEPDDMLRHLRFERGALHSYVDYERGRMCKTRIDVRADGTFTVETVNRGQAATRWLSRLQGKEHLALVPDDMPKPN